jgi:hypothetical protein
MQFQNGNAEIEFGCTLSDVVLAAPILPHRTGKRVGHPKPNREVIRSPKRGT